MARRVRKNGVGKLLLWGGGAVAAYLVYKAYKAGTLPTVSTTPVTFQVPAALHGLGGYRKSTAESHRPRFGKAPGRGGSVPWFRRHATTTHEGGVTYGRISS